MIKKHIYRSHDTMKRRACKARTLEICAAMQYQPAYVFQRSRKNELVNLRRTIAMKLFYEGFTPREIAHAFGRERTAIYCLLKLRIGQENHRLTPQGTENRA